MKSTKLANFLDTLQMKGQYWFIRDHAVSQLGISKTAFRMSAYRLEKEKRIMHVGKEFFVIIPIEYRLAGAPPPYWYIDQYMHFLDRDYYICLLTAAAHYGASHQVSQQFQVMVEYPLKLGSMNSTNLFFFNKKHLQSTPTEKIKVQTGYVKISTIEATALDLVQYYKAAGGWGLVSTIMIELASSLNNPKLIAQTALNGLYEIPTIQRLGYLLDSLGFGETTKELYTLIEQKWKEKGRKKYFLLNPQKPHRSNHKKVIKWQIIVNDKIEIDAV